ncbi:protein kinase domain-containing protein [Euzebya pacifica]|uniref:protein kinase domain-containing protein n=1 Tax=Euzebya pacifica TaxID=1608957 RepID=UPI0030F5820D
MDVLPAGHEIGGYRIVRVAGRGAVGVVYEARHVTLGKRVAIKTLNRTFAKEQEFRARFDREAEGAASLDHPNITQVFDSGEQDGLPYLVMTYIDGPDLERVLVDRDRPLEPAQAVLICRAVAEALDAASEIGLAHRDVKPANILLQGWEEGKGRNPRVYLTDFGLTKHNAAATVTRTGQFVGTLLYMAPEQIEGKAVPASDQYSLACVLWECIVGLPPYLPAGGSNLSLLTAHLSDPIPVLSRDTKGRFPTAADAVLAKAMAKKADDRYPLCTAFMDAAAEALGLAATPPETPRVSSGWGSAPAKPVADEPDEDDSGPAPVTTVISAEQMRASQTTPSTRPSPTSSQAPSGTSPQQPPSGAPSGGPAQQAPHQHAPPHHQGHPAGLDPSGRSLQGQAWGGGPAGLPPGLPPSAYQAGQGSGSSSRTWIVVLLLVLLAVVVGVVAFLLASSGDDSADAGNAPESAVASTDPSEPGDAALQPVSDDGQDDEANDGADGSDAAAPADDVGDVGPTDPTVTDPTPSSVPAAQQGRIAFVGDGRVWVQAADGSSAQEVLDVSGAGNGQPAWQPGHEAVLAVQDGRLVLVDLDSGASRVITEGPSHSDPAWFPDGQRIVFSAPDELGGRDLFVTDLEGNVTPLGLSARIDSGDSPSVLNRPAVSPLDESIAFHVNTANGLDIWVQRPDGTVELAAGEPGSDDFHPAFGTSGELIWSSNRSGVERVYVRRVGSSEDIEVAMPPGASVKDADVSPCGDVLVVQVDDPADGGSRIAHRGLGPGSGPLEQVPVPEGVADATDPSWAGQSCPA